MRMLVCTCGPTEAASLVRTLVEERLVGCGNILPGVRSIYHWQGAVEDTEEALVLMETSNERVAAAMNRIRELHSYDVPKILSFEPAEWNAAYVDWLRGATDPDVQR